MAFKSRYDFGNHQASRGCIITTPKGYRKDGTKRGVMILHGAGELCSSPLNYSTGGKPKEANIIAAIASVYPTVIIDGGTFASGGVNDSDNWGSPAAVTEMDNGMTTLFAAGNNGGGAIPGAAIVVGLSMGHAWSLNYAQTSAAKAAKCRAILGILPVNDLDDIRDNNRGGFRASISNVWATGAWISAGNPALPAAANPAVPANQTRWLAIPQRLYYASDDSICTPATVAAMIANVPIITTVNMGVGDHTDASFGHVDIPGSLMPWLASVA